MRQRFIFIIFLTVFLSAAFAVKHLYFPRLHGQANYYFLCLVWFCGALIVLVTASMIWSRLRSRKKLKKDNIQVDWANRRNAYRIIYPAFCRPVLVVEQIDNNPARLLEYPVMDLSQGGSCFLDDGSLGAMQSFAGYIRFESGDRIQVSGQLIRKTGNQISVEFQNAIDWSTMLNEQRRISSQMKSAR